MRKNCNSEHAPVAFEVISFLLISLKLSIFVVLLFVYISGYNWMGWSSFHFKTDDFFSFTKISFPSSLYLSSVPFRRLPSLWKSSWHCWRCWHIKNLAIGMKEARRRSKCVYSLEYFINDTCFGFFLRSS